jgi:predicted nuclease of predicted toxin-antitoxin system
VRLLADEHIDPAIIKGLLRRVPDADIISVYEVALNATPDAEILRWAAEHGRIMLTEDVNTLIADAIKRVENGQPMPGIIAIPARVPIGVVIEELDLIVTVSEGDEWDNRIAYLPLT